MNRLWIVLTATALVWSCTTVKMAPPQESPEEVEAAQAQAYTETDAVALMARENLPPYTTQIITQEKPIYVPTLDAQGRVVAPSSGTATEGNPGLGLPSDADRSRDETMLDSLAATKSAVERSLQFPFEWDGGAVSYDYNATFQYRVYATPLRITTIDLEPEETLLGDAVISDSVRWQLGGTISTRNGRKMQSIHIKPSVPGLQTSLILNTDRRRYFIVLYSTDSVYMLNVRFSYASQLPTMWLAPGRVADSKNLETVEGATKAATTFREGVNYLYDLDLGWGGAPYWTPTRVFDDGEHTYFILPEKVLPNRKLPSLALANGDVIAYRPQKNVLVADVIEKEYRLFLGDRSIKVINRGFDE